MGRARAVALLAAALALQACVPAQGVREASAIALTWESARVFLPGSLVGRGAQHPRGLMSAPYVRETIASRAEGTRFPIVLYLHGCAEPSDIGSVGDFFAARGYAVIAPDSFANPAPPPTVQHRDPTSGQRVADRQAAAAAGDPLRRATPARAALGGREPDVPVRHQRGRSGGHALRRRRVSRAHRARHPLRRPPPLSPAARIGDDVSARSHGQTRPLAHGPGNSPSVPGRRPAAQPFRGTRYRHPRGVHVQQDAKGDTPMPPAGARVERATVEASSFGDTLRWKQRCHPW